MDGKIHIMEEKKITVKKMIIAIDGPSASGKSTVGKLLAKRLSYLYVDTGAMYRGLAWKFLEVKVDLNDLSEVQRVCKETDLYLSEKKNEMVVMVDQRDVTSELRSPEIGMTASKISSIKTVRDRLFELQRKMGEKGGLVMEGRDIGTVVFPEAEVKFFLDALQGVRGERRFLEFKTKGVSMNLSETVHQIEERDRMDRERAFAPLKCADDAIRIDSTQMDIEQVISRMLEVVKGCTEE